MRGVVLGLALFVAATTSGCAAGLRQHAQVVSATAELLKAAKAEINAERLADEKVLLASIEPGESPYVTERREEKLEASFAPVMQGYQLLRDAWLDYRAAVDGEDIPAVTKAAAELLRAWRALAEAGDAVGAHIPAPVPELEKLAGEKP